MARSIFSHQFTAVILTTVILVWGFGPTGAHAQSDTKQENQHKATVLQLIADDVQQAQIDLGAPGLTLGDRRVFTDNLMLFQGGPRVGIAGGDCGVVRIDTGSNSFTYHCVVSLEFPEGLITAQGLLTLTNGLPPPTFTLAVTGGTGRYEAVQGRIEIHSIAGTLSQLTLFLTKKAL